MHRQRKLFMRKTTVSKLILKVMDINWLFLNLKSVNKKSLETFVKHREVDKNVKST